MKIKDNAFVSMDYVLTLDSGEVADKSEEGIPLCFIFNSNQIIGGLEKQLSDMETGQTAKITVEADEAYGTVNPELINEIPRENFPEEIEIKPGMIYQADSPSGPFSLQVKEIKDDAVLVDLNHPLAGQRLHFEVKILEVREATDADREALAASCGCGCSEDESSCGGGCEGHHHH